MRYIFVSVLLLIGAGSLWAEECPPGTRLRPIGTVAVNNTNGAGTQQSTGGHLIRASRVACAGTACAATIYDNDSANDGDSPSDPDVVDEPGAPANTSEWTEYDPPLSVTTGLNVHDDGNVNAFLAYECRP